jgi:hypothetical protein
MQSRFAAQIGLQMGMSRGVTVSPTLQEMFRISLQNRIVSESRELPPDAATQVKCLLLPQGTPGPILG